MLLINLLTIFTLRNKCEGALTKNKTSAFDDVLADDCGSWVNNGQHQFIYEMNEDGVFERVGRRASFDTSRLTIDWLKLHRRYYDHKDSRDSSGARDFEWTVLFHSSQVM